MSLIVIGLLLPIVKQRMAQSGGMMLIDLPDVVMGIRIPGIHFQYQNRK
jgi:hypothetical protein